MIDDRDEMLDRLFKAARARKTDFDTAEEFFETRLMANIAERREKRSLWSAWAWRLVPWFAMIVIMVGTAGYVLDPGRSGDMFASLTGGDDEYQVSSLFIGE